MKVKEIYDLSIKIGIKNDIRSKKEVDAYLERKKENYSKLSKEEKTYFDREQITNPFSDSRIHFDSGKKVKKIFASIDVTPGSILLARELGADLIFNHHPVGLALAGLDDVMSLQVDLMEQLGIPVNIAEKMIHKRISEVARGINPSNHYAVVDAARLAGVSLINVHTPADNSVFQFVTKKIAKAKPRYVSDIINSLMEIEEYQIAKRQGGGPMIFSGNENNRCGQVAVSEMTGGTEGSNEIYDAMANAGVGTIIGMHQSERHRKAAEKANINVVIAGHISSDSIGMNLILDEIEKKGVEVVPFGGLIRVKRKK
ncbi:MAG TPA: NGG1p interacting factor NIF3 [Candidatus Moranbacteria bacterium]|nr:NGG1p interacting factor NIF3 [Candidatus Moranbacteria bacterium]